MCRSWRGAVFDEAFVCAHSGEMERAYALLADERSRTVFLDTVRFKLSGRLCYLCASETDKDEVFRTVLRLGPEERFADLGAYNGDTIRELLHYTGGRFTSVTALEPDRRSFRKLSAYAEEQLTGDITLEQAGAWSEDTVLCFSDRGATVAHLACGQGTRMRALDSVLRGRPCTYLKMDVEGAERETCGAAQTIRSWRPKLNLAAYHRSGDFFSLRCRCMRFVRITGFTCATIRMCRHGIPTCMRSAHKTGKEALPAGSALYVWFIRLLRGGSRRHLGEQIFRLGGVLFQFCGGCSPC